MKQRKITLSRAQAHPSGMNCLYKHNGIKKAKLIPDEDSHDAAFIVDCENGYKTNVTLSDEGHHRVFIDQDIIPDRVDSILSSMNAYRYGAMLEYWHKSTSIERLEILDELRVRNSYGNKLAFEATHYLLRKITEKVEK